MADRYDRSFEGDAELARKYFEVRRKEIIREDQIYHKRESPRAIEDICLK